MCVESRFIQNGYFLCVFDLGFWGFGFALAVLVCLWALWCWVCVCLAFLFSPLFKCYIPCFFNMFSLCFFSYLICSKTVQYIYTYIYIYMYVCMYVCMCNFQIEGLRKSSIPWSLFKCEVNNEK